MANETQEDLDKFLSNIDDIHRLVQNLSSDDTNNVSKAMQESDVLLKQISKTGVDRTVINKTSSEQQQQPQISPNTFMHALEKDAEDRAEKRRQNKLLADELKSKGNEAFHQQLYDQAIDYYTQGLKLKKDYDILYTNRAQVYVKQGRYDEAINDCEWALKVTRTFIKAYVIKGKCLMNLKEFNRAREEFHQAKEIAIENFESDNVRRMIEECLEEVNKQEEKSQREESARKFLANEDSSAPMNLTNTLNKLNVSQQPLIYYIGGIDLLNQLINNETTRTAFRVNNGFNLFNSHPIITENENENLSESIFNLMINLSQDDENMKQCLESKYLNKYLTKNLYSSIAFQYFIEISLKSNSRIIFMEKIILNNLIQYLMNIIEQKKSNRIYATQLLSNLAVESKIKQHFNNKNELDKIILILKSSSNDGEFQNIMFSLLTNLCSEKSIRSYVINQTDIFEILIDNYKNDNQENFLGLLINLTNEKSETLEKNYKKLSELILIKFQNSIYYQRILTLLGNITMHYEQVIDILNQYKTIPKISQLLQQNSNEEILRAGIRLLALGTQSNEQVQQTIASDTKLLSVIYEQFNKSQHSLLIGNASLLFGHIINHSSTCIFLKKTPGIEKTISQMLKLVEQTWLSKPAKKNVAIFITKLVKADESFLQEFRKQHGTEILHSALKDVEL